MRKQNKRLGLSSQTVRILGITELNLIGGGQRETTERESIVYWCPTNTSIQRSCSSCP